MDRELVAVLLAGAAVRIALMPPEQVEALVRTVLLRTVACCRRVALQAGTAGLKVEAFYQQRVGA